MSSCLFPLSTLCNKKPERIQLSERFRSKLVSICKRAHSAARTFCESHGQRLTLDATIGNGGRLKMDDRHALSLRLLLFVCTIFAIYAQHSLKTMTVEPAWWRILGKNRNRVRTRSYGDRSQPEMSIRFSSISVIRSKARFNDSKSSSSGPLILIAACGRVSKGRPLTARPKMFVRILRP